jgi:alpha-1,2-mannosyltransferase
MRPLADAARRVGLPALSILVAAGSIGAILAAGWTSGTLGYDYLCYDAAARRLLAGQPIYDLSFTSAGPFGLFDYPFTFLILVLPFAALLPPTGAVIAWTAMLVGAFLAAIALLPVRTQVRWLVLLLASLAWPVVYSLKLGQVGGLLFLLFAVAWRWLERDVPVGVAIAVGTAIKLQPGVVFIWAALRRRWGVLVVGAVVSAAAVVLVTVPAGVHQWFDLVTLYRQISDPIATPGLVTLGALAYQAGAPEGVAVAIQAASVVAALAVLVRVSLRPSPEAGFLAAIVVSQLVSPIVWQHYALVLILPVAWFLDRGAYAAALVPLAVAWPVVGLTPPIVYPILYAATLGGLLMSAERAPARSRLVPAHA